MSWHYLVNQIIQHEQQEIALYQQIAAGAPTQSLRNMILEMAEHERRELHFWHDLLQSGGYMPGGGMHGGGYMPDGGYMPGGGFMPYDKKEPEKK
jgi:uncharacterized protein YigE (DUF2233 family)